MYGKDYIKIVQESTCLGLRIDNRLDWKHQLLNVSKSFSKKLGALKRIKSLPSKVLEESTTEQLLPRQHTAFQRGETVLKLRLIC